MELKKKKGKELLEDKIFTWSNFLSLSRVLLLPFFIYFVQNYVKNPVKIEYFYLTFLTCILAILSDYFDGFLARLLKQESVLGRYLDPLCDKVVTIVGIAVIVKYFDFPFWVFIFYIFREILGTWLGSFLYFKRGIQGKPNIWGKVGVGLVSVTVIWYMSLPLIRLHYPSNYFFNHPEFASYILVVILIIGIIVYSKKYWNIVFHPTKLVINPMDKKQNKTFHVIP